MTDAAFLRTICERPEDDGARLVYADYLESQGYPDAWRGEFIRVQIELTTLRCWGEKELPECEPAGLLREHWCMACDRSDTLRARERALLKAHIHEWAPPAPPGLENWYGNGTFGWWAFGKPDENRVEFFMARGFPSSLRLTVEAFCGGTCPRCGGDGLLSRERVWRYGHPSEECPPCFGTGRLPGVAAAVFANSPIMEVTLTDRESYGLPRELWDLVIAQDKCEVFGPWADFPTAAAANAASPRPPTAAH